MPEKFTASLLGETLLGSSKVFSSNGLSEVRTIAFPIPFNLPVPLRSISVSSDVEAALTILRITSPDLSSRDALAHKLLTLVRSSVTS